LNKIPTITAVKIPQLLLLLLISLNYDFALFLQQTSVICSSKSIYREGRHSNSNKTHHSNPQYLLKSNLNHHPHLSSKHPIKRRTLLNQKKNPYHFYYFPLSSFKKRALKSLSIEVISKGIKQHWIPWTPATAKRMLSTSHHNLLSHHSNSLVSLQLIKNHPPITS